MKHLLCLFTLVMTLGCWSISGLCASSSLPLALSQDQWVGAKQEITLSTGVTLKYVEMGQADGAPLILLHGMTDNSRSWSLVVSNFTQKYHVYMLDQRGHGDSDKPDLRMYPVTDYANDLAAFMDAKGIGKANVVGHSLGSMIVQAFAMNYPEKVNKIVLVASALVQFDSLGWWLYEAAVGFGDKQPDAEFMAAWYENPNPVDQDFLKREMGESQSIPPHTWRAIIKGALSSDLTPFMDELKAPTLILWGSLDGFFDKEAQEALQQAIPHAKFIGYENIGHNIQWEIPVKMAKDINNFLAGK